MPWVLIVLGLVSGAWLSWWLGIALILFGAYRLAEHRVPQQFRHWSLLAGNGLAVLAVTVLLAGHWLPLGPAACLPWFSSSSIFMPACLPGASSTRRFSCLPRR